jgi:LuxR family maltose regulon positive regulatory protein
MVLDTRLALATDDVSRAAELVTELSADARTLRQQIVATLLQARVDLTRDTTAAMANLRQAITLARGQRFVRQLALDLPELDTALRQIVAEGEDPYLLSLLLATTERPSPDAVGTALAHTLSTREMIVLRYLPTPLANKEIAAELHVSVNTLKTHLKSINRKLGTGSRTEAIAVARALTLV